MSEVPSPLRSGSASPAARWGAPLCLLAVVAVTDLVIGDRLHVLPVMAAVPVLAAALNGVGVTAALAGAATATTALVQLVQGRWSTETGDVTILTLVVVSLAGLPACSVRCRRERRSRQAQSVADTARQAALRPLPRRMGTVHMCATYVPARSEGTGGGDFYEALHTPYGVRVLVGDIQGKGLSAVAASATLLGSFREAAHEEECLADVCNRLETSATRQIRALRDEPFSERYATAVLVELPHDEPVARVIHCGQPEPLRVRGDKVSAHTPSAPGAPIGLARLVGAEPVTQTIEFRPGDRLLLYTNGFIEARDRGGRHHDLGAHAHARSAEPLEDMVRGLRGDLLRHSEGGPADDGALVVLEQHTGPHRASYPWSR
ncbi:PP2C family protein-serine/threonine phosphatase [Streptomyces herbicida]|uniref:PP2C family protein-serine/threonine phosphatase n=1 Tax=Streptomyces herbicida TaxID=3065675 RepID=UPI00292CA5FC|nr:PP2C family protein-serine/threonine phosphatase [Streptomyces sp. NEAU-HV9]